jgi:hypothetical protein
MVFPGKEESVGEDRDELDIESAVADENIDPAVFSIRNALEQPDARVYTTLELHSKLSALRGEGAKAVNGHTYSPNSQRENRPQPAIPTRCAKIDFLATFSLTRRQDVVWPTGKQMEIIDSLFHNFYVPPVIFAVMQDEDGEEVRVCVDGKQRLTSIVKFLDGHVCTLLHTLLTMYELILSSTADCMCAIICRISHIRDVTLYIRQGS